MRRAYRALLCLLVACTVPAAARAGLALLVNDPGYTPAGYVQLFASSGKTQVATYDSLTDIFSISGPQTYGIMLPCPPGQSLFCHDQLLASGVQTLQLDIDKHGKLHGGAFSFVGSSPALGVNTNQLLFSAKVTDASITPEGTGVSPVSGSFFQMRLALNLDPLLISPALGDGWGERMQLFGLSGIGFLPINSVLTAANLFQYSWSVEGPADYYDLEAFTRVHRVPEPDSLLVLALALGLLALAARIEPSA